MMSVLNSNSIELLCKVTQIPEQSYSTNYSHISTITLEHRRLQDLNKNARRLECVSESVSEYVRHGFSLDARWGGE